MKQQLSANSPALANGDLAAEQIHSREDFVALLRALVAELHKNPERWENRDLASFLEAMAAWTEDMDGYYQHRGEAVPQQPCWQTLGQILLAARVYE